MDNCIEVQQSIYRCEHNPNGASNDDFWPHLIVTLIVIAATITVLTIFWKLVGFPRWRVWASHQQGLADLQRAKNEQQIQVAEAQGRVDAAQLNKQAAVIEAQAVGLQITEIGAQLTQHDLYLKWQWIKMMEEGDQSVIYVPTEAGLPILEAGKRS